MSDRDHATWNPYRVSRAIDPTGPTLTRSQQRVLWILLERCPEPGMAVRSREVSEEARKRLGAIMLVLRKLADKRLVALVDDAGGKEGDCTWAPTLLGRARRRPSSATFGIPGGGLSAAGRAGALDGARGAGTPTARVTISFTDTPAPTWSGGLAEAFTDAEVWPAGDAFVFVDDVFAGMRDDAADDPPGVRPLDQPIDDPREAA